jgi:hypothetical protein
MYGQVNLAFVIAGAAPLPPGAVQSANYVSVTPKYFGVMGIPLLRGRVFNPEDSASSPRVAIISATLARRYFKDENPVGKKVVFGFPPDTNITWGTYGMSRSRRIPAQCCMFPLRRRPSGVTCW